MRFPSTEVDELSSLFDIRNPLLRLDFFMVAGMRGPAGSIPAVLGMPALISDPYCRA